MCCFKVENCPKFEDEHLSEKFSSFAKSIPGGDVVHGVLGGHHLEQAEDVVAGLQARKSEVIIFTFSSVVKEHLKRTQFRVETCCENKVRKILLP
jgi:hypothetical protein